MLINHDDTVAIAIKGNAQIRTVRQYCLLQSLGMSRAYFGIDVKPIGFIAHADDGRAKLTQHTRRDAIACTVRSVKHDG